jgi:nuclear cap-binding protein subunit 1
MPQVLAQATELLFERINSMKASCIERLASWFAYHLSNFQYKWSWEDWKQDGEDQHDLETPKNKFLRETLIRCMRLAYHQRITDIIPQSMGALVPANPKPTYKYESEAAADLEGTSVANKLLELFRERAIPEDVFQVLRDIPDKYNEADDEYETFNPLKIEVFTSTLLYFGSKSFSHAFAALAKYHTIFKILFDNENSQLVILKALHEIWKNHQQMMVVMVDKMLKTQIVECASVAKWIFSTDMNQELTSFYVWEILHATISRMSKQVDKVKHEYMQLSQKFNKPSLDENESNEVTEDEHDAKLQTLNLLKEQQKTLFMVIIKRFMECLSEHKSNADLEIKVEVGEKALIADSPYWQKWASDRFEDIFLVHNEEILPILDDVKAELVTPATPKHISKIFKMILSLKK